MEEIKTKSWYSFYKGRMGDDYQAYFETKYAIMLGWIRDSKHFLIKEEGMGIGCITKALSDVKAFYGSDGCHLMVGLASIKNPHTFIYRENMLSGAKIIPSTDLVVTHGVLEHMENQRIDEILARYKKADVPSIHYVPTDVYTEPSFGDERLLPTSFWTTRFRPKQHFTFNEGKDLCLIF